jgi:hypothetical protein
MPIVCGGQTYDRDRGKLYVLQQIPGSVYPSHDEFDNRSRRVVNQSIDPVPCLRLEGFASVQTNPR